MVPKAYFDLKIFQEINDKNGLGHTYRNIGNLTAMIGELDIDRQWEFNGIKGVDFNPFTDNFNKILLDVVDSGFYDALFERSEYVISLADEIQRGDAQDPVIPSRSHGRTSEH